MANSVLTIQVHADEGASTMADRYLNRGSVNARQQALLLEKLIAAVASGALSGRITTHLENGAGTRATKTVTCTVAGAAGDTVTINGVTLTEGVDFARGATDATLATALGAAIEAHPLLRGTVDATVATNVVTVAYKIPGVTGNAFTIATNDAATFAIATTVTAASGTVTRGFRSHAFGKRES